MKDELREGRKKKRTLRFGNLNKTYFSKTEARVTEKIPWKLKHKSKILSEMQIYTGLFTLDNYL